MIGDFGMRIFVVAVPGLNWRGGDLRILELALQNASLRPATNAQPPIKLPTINR
jgi:hypothetical protein